MKKITKDWVVNQLPLRKNNVHKGSFGSILCIGGSDNFGGAILLTSAAALATGASMVTVATVPENKTALHVRVPEAMYVPLNDPVQLLDHLKKVDIILIGPGLGRSEHSASTLVKILSEIKPTQKLILDADALFHLATRLTQLPELTTPSIITPHLGEWERLTGIQPPAEELTENLRKHHQLQTTTVLKKERTEIYTTRYGCWKNTTGNPGMAIGGMGDTLAGIIAGMISQFKDAELATLCAIFLHSYAADLIYEKEIPVLPHRLIEKLPQTLKELYQLKEGTTLETTNNHH